MGGGTGDNPELVIRVIFLFVIRITNAINTLIELSILLSEHIG